MAAKYKATFQVTVDMEMEVAKGDDPYQAANRILKQAFPPYAKVKLLKLNRRTQPSGSRVVLGEFAPEEVLPFISDVEAKRQYMAKGEAWDVNMDSHRYFVFRVSRCCAACGLEGTKFLLEKNPRDKNPHFNLYAEEGGKLVLMTKDHIQPLSAGGKNELANYQTLCSVCNNLKGNTPLTLEEIRQLREVHNAERDGMSRKRLAALMEHLRQEFFAKHAPEPEEPEPDATEPRLACDVSIVDEGERLVCLPMKTAISKNMNIIASMKRGTLLSPLAEDEEAVYVAPEQRRVKIYRHMIVRQ